MKLLGSKSLETKRLILHKPHPSNIIKEYKLKEIIVDLLG